MVYPFCAMIRITTTVWFDAAMSLHTLQTLLETLHVPTDFSGTFESMINDVVADAMYEANFPDTPVLQKKKVDAVTLMYRWTPNSHPEEQALLLVWKPYGKQGPERAVITRKPLSLPS